MHIFVSLMICVFAAVREGFMQQLVGIRRGGGWGRRGWGGDCRSPLVPDFPRRGSVPVVSAGEKELCGAQPQK